MHDLNLIFILNLSAKCAMWLVFASEKKNSTVTVELTTGIGVNKYSANLYSNQQISL